MNKSKTFFSIFTLFIFCLATVAGAFAQTENKPPQADPVYEVVLHTVVASNNASGKSDVPQALSGVIKKLKNNLPLPRKPDSSPSKATKIIECDGRFSLK
jgi:hypothetical protein